MHGRQAADVQADSAVAAGITARDVTAIDRVNTVASRDACMVARDGGEGVALIPLRSYPHDVRQLLHHLISNAGQADNHPDDEDRRD